MCSEMTKVRLFKDLKKGSNMLFSMNQFGQNFHFFQFLLFSQIFWMELKRRPLDIRKSSKYS